jgi:hypothetical protein
VTPEYGWKWGLGDDNTVEIIIEPDFHGDLLQMAKLRPIWIVNTELNRTQIDHAWTVGKDANLYEVSRIPVANSDNLESNLIMILGGLDDHYIGGYDFVVHGLKASASVRKAMQVEGFRITETTADGFVAQRILGVRKRLTGRS